MNRICRSFAYSEGPVESCFWNETASAPPRAHLEGQARVDVAIIGGGFTGLSAALRLADAGRSVAVLEEKQPGWGASGRNGGFCCLGGSALDGAKIRKRFGDASYRDYRLAERDAVDFVDDLTTRLGFEIDRQSVGETLLAHRPKDFSDFEQSATEIRSLYGVEAEIFGPEELLQRGMNGPFHGGMTTPIGFGLNPKKYALQLADSAEKAGARIFGNTPVENISGEDGAFRVKTLLGVVEAAKVILATNGYSSESTLNWMRGRYFPAQSSVVVTRRMTEEELNAQGWTSGQMSYDSRNLLHYFRLLPDRRFLLGMRGGLATSKRVHHKIRSKVRRDFERMFPAWSHVETPWYWSGFVCYSASQTPFVGEVPNMHGLFASFAYHGNGIAMGSYCGALAADQILGRNSLRHPKVVSSPPPRFPGGSFRRLALYPAYLAYRLADL